MLFFVIPLRDHRSLHPFPTRRSSDLLTRMMRTAAHTTTKAKSVPMLVRSARTRNGRKAAPSATATPVRIVAVALRSEEHTSELQSLTNLVCRLLLEKKKKKNSTEINT